MALECVRMRERRSNSFVRPDGWRRGGWFRVAFFPRRSRSRIRVTRRRRNQCAVERKATRRTKPGPARPFFFAGQPSNFTTLHLPAFFLRLLLPSFLARLCSSRVQGSESNEVAVYRYRPTGNSNLPLLRLILN